MRRACFLPAVTLTALLLLTGCSSGTLPSAPEEPSRSEPASSSAAQDGTSDTFTDAVAAETLCAAIEAGDLTNLGAVGGSTDSSYDETNSRCTLTASDAVPSQVSIQLVHNLKTPAGAAFNTADWDPVGDSNCTGGGDKATRDLAGHESAVYWCLGSETDQNTYPVSTYYSNSDLLGTSLRCEISTVNRSDFSVDIAEAFCIAILTELDDAASIGDDPTPAEAEPPSATDLQASREAFIQRWAQAGFPAQSEAPEYYCDSWPETTAMHYDWLKADS